MFLRLFFLLVLFNLVFVMAYCSFSKSGTKSIAKQNISGNGEKLFKANCAGCHINGQNLIKPDKPIIASPKLDSKKSFRIFLESPPPPMPNFKNITTMSSELDALYSYVTSLMGT